MTIDPNSRVVRWLMTQPLLAPIETATGDVMHFGFGPEGWAYRDEYGDAYLAAPDALAESLISFACCEALNNHSEQYAVWLGPTGTDENDAPDLYGDGMDFTCSVCGLDEEYREFYGPSKVAVLLAAVEAVCVPGEFQ